MKLRDVLGFKSSPQVGAAYTGDGTEDNQTLLPDYGPGVIANMVPLQMMDQPGDFISNRGYGTHNLIPGRALSAQTRLKNMQYEYPAAYWTNNVEGPPWVVRVPGLPQQQINLATANDFSVQPDFMSPLTGMQMNNQENWFSQIRGIIQNAAQQKMAAQQNQNQQTMFPSIFDPSFGDE